MTVIEKWWRWWQKRWDLLWGAVRHVDPPWAVA